MDGITSAELDRIVDTRWDPPVTAAVRLVSVIGDTMQHLGQAAYVRGLASGGTSRGIARMPPIASAGSGAEPGVGRRH